MCLFWFLCPALGKRITMSSHDFEEMNLRSSLNEHRLEMDNDYWSEMCHEKYQKIKI